MGKSKKMKRKVSMARHRHLFRRRKPNALAFPHRVFPHRVLPPPLRLRTSEQSLPKVQSRQKQCPHHLRYPRPMLLSHLHCHLLLVRLHHHLPLLLLAQLLRKHSWTVIMTFISVSVRTCRVRFVFASLCAVWHACADLYVHIWCDMCTCAIVFIVPLSTLDFDG